MMVASIDTVVLPALIGLGGLAVVFAGILSIASRVFAVHEDPLVEELNEQLPGANCGSCGYPGCRSYAEALVKGEASVDLCGPGGSAFIEIGSKLLGMEFSGAEKQVAFIHCKGAPKQAVNFVYDGIETCRAAMMVSGGQTGCPYGCLGFSDCVVACKYDAIKVREDGLPVVDAEKCISCRECVDACPRDLIEMVSEKKQVHILCSSKARGKAVKDVCVPGCIGCTKCVKECPFDAITMDKGLAIIDYDKCTNCAKCVKACPVDVIHNYRRQEWFTWEEKPKKAVKKAVTAA